MKIDDLSSVALNSKPAGRYSWEKSVGVSTSKAGKKKPRDEEWACIFINLSPVQKRGEVEDGGTRGLRNAPRSNTSIDLNAKAKFTLAYSENKVLDRKR